MGKLSQAIAHGAHAAAGRRQLRRLPRPWPASWPRPTRSTLVNSVNPVRIEGQKTAAFEIVDALGDAPDIHCLPVGNAGNITAYWQGYREYCRDAASRGRPRTPRDVGLPGRRRRADRARPPGRRTPRPSPRRSGSATRRRGRRPIAARDESGGLIDAVTDEQILPAHRLLSAARGRSSSSRRRRRSVAGLLAGRTRPGCCRAGPARRLHRHRARAQGPAVGAQGRGRRRGAPARVPRRRLHRGRGRSGLEG